MTNKNRKVLMALSILIMFSNILIAWDTGNGIDKEFLVKTDGTELYLKVRGQDIKKPLLLYLHGGPGDATGPLIFQVYAGPELEKHFIVGYLHQRNTCMSPAAPINTLTIKQFIEDVHHVASFLKEKFHQDKIFLLGHSFGGILGFLYLLIHGETIEKFISAGGAFSSTSLEENGYQTVMELAKNADNQEAVEQLKSLGPPPYENFQEGMVWRTLGMSLLNEMGEGISKNLDMSKVMSNSGIDSINPEWYEKSMVIAGTMWKELITIEIEDKVKNISTPMLLITGEKDIMVPFSMVEKGYKNYGGEKEHINFKESNHFMFVDEPGLFVSKVIEFLQK